MSELPRMKREYNGRFRGAMNAPVDSPSSLSPGNSYNNTNNIKRIRQACASCRYVSICAGSFSICQAISLLFAIDNCNIIWLQFGWLTTYVFFFLLLGGRRRNAPGNDRHASIAGAVTVRVFMSRIRLPLQRIIISLPRCRLRRRTRIVYVALEYTQWHGIGIAGC